MTIIRCDNPSPHGPHRTDRGPFGVRDCPGVGLELLDSSPERCRPVTVDIDGEDVTVTVRGHEPLTDEDREHLAELVKAAQRLAARHCPKETQR